MTTTGKLAVSKTPNPYQFWITSDPVPYENWETEYVGISGYFGPHGPHVFAAAPEMLEALESVVAHWTAQFERKGHSAPEWCKKARAALEKAKGESP